MVDTERGVGDSSLYQKKGGLYNTKPEKDSAMIEGIEKKDYDVEDSWGNVDETQKEAHMKKKAKKQVSTNIFKSVLIVSLVFFIGAMSLFIWRWVADPTLVRPDAVEMSVDAPIAIDSGKPFTFTIEINNTNPTALEDVEMYIELPEGAQVQYDENTYSNRVSRSLGTVASGQIVTEPFTMTVFGEMDEKKSVTTYLDYRFTDSNARFEGRVSHGMTILSSPIRFTVTLLDEVTSGEAVDIEMAVMSNSTESIDELLLDVDYPAGFTFIDATLEPEFGESSWRFSDISPFGIRRLVVTGTLEGFDSDEEVFKFKVGYPESKQTSVVKVLLASVEETIVVKEPFIGMNMQIDRRDADNFVPVTPGGGHACRIDWTNNSGQRLYDMSIEVEPDVRIVRKSIEVDDGIYRSIDDVVLWDDQTNGRLAVVDAGDSGSMNFTFRLESIEEEEYYDGDIEIHLRAVAQAKRLTPDNKPEEINIPVIGTGRLVSQANLVTKMLYYDGPFENTGPMPPKINRQTTYTVVWQISNTLNDLEDVVLEASLPTYVEWLGVVEPADADIEYKGLKGGIVWNVGDVERGTGYIRPPKEIAFQIGFVPTLSQVLNSPYILNRSVLMGKDTFSGVRIEKENIDQNIMLTLDPFFNESEGYVRE